MFRRLPSALHSREYTQSRALQHNKAGEAVLNLGCSHESIDGHGKCVGGNTSRCSTATNKYDCARWECIWNDEKVFKGGSYRFSPKEIAGASTISPPVPISLCAQRAFKNGVLCFAVQDDLCYSNDHDGCNAS